MGRFWQWFLFIGLMPAPAAGLSPATTAQRSTPAEAARAASAAPASG